MDPVDIGKAYNQLTHLWMRSDFDMRNGIAQHKRAISFAKSRSNALDIGCGCTGRFIELFKSEGFTPSGLDIASNMIELAQKKHPEVHFIEGDICSVSLPLKYDFISAWDSIWHVPLAEQHHVLTKIVQSLNVGGIFIFSFGGTDEANAHRDSTMGVELYYSSLGTDGVIGLLLELGCNIRHLAFDQGPELHAYLIVEKRIDSKGN